MHRLDRASLAWRTQNKANAKTRAFPKPLVAANAIIRGRGDLTVAEANGLMKLVRGFVSVLAAREMTDDGHDR